jgi:ribonucleoside-diphosphate reductase beta chain
MDFQGTAPKILTARNVYRPFEYPHFFEYFRKQQQAHWLPSEVPMETDIHDYRFVLSPAERSLVTQILRFFTQSDIEVNNNYNTRLIPVFPKPEIKMMLSAFASMESVHVWAYSYLNDSLGLPEKEYSAFLDYRAMRDKYEFFQRFDTDTIEKLLLNLAVFGGFIEGVSLFSSFAILMNFPRLGKLKSVGQIVTWSVRDESLHSTAVCHLFRDLAHEMPGVLGPDLKRTVVGACKEMVALEDAFIDACFSMGPVPGLAPDEVKQYIRYTADRKLLELGVDKLFYADNPLTWMDMMINAKEHTNFFENRATEYAKGAVVLDWEEITSSIT